jgi:hypothetical protein
MPKLARKGLLHESAHPYATHLTAALATLGWEILNHPPYSLYLAVNDYYLFGPLLKEHLGGQNFKIQNR